MGFNRDNADSNGGKGIVRDVRRIQAGGAMTAAELRQFIRQFKGKSPQEVLGAVAQSGLAQAVGAATIGCAALVAVFTVLPYAWGKAVPAESKPARKATAAKTVPSAAAEQPPAAVRQPATQASAAGGGASQELLDKLGEGDAKTSDPRSNPLEESADDLLKDLK
jgi:hypothetical protein